MGWDHPDLESVDFDPTTASGAGGWWLCEDGKVYAKINGEKFCVSDMVMPVLTSVVPSRTLDQTDFGSLLLFIGASDATWNLPESSTMRPGNALGIRNDATNSNTLTLAAASGDTIDGNSSLDLAVGSAHLLLPFSDGYVTLASAGGSGGGAPYIDDVDGSSSTTRTLLDSEVGDLLFLTGSSDATWTLPAASGDEGDYFVIRNTTTNSLLTLAADGSDTVNAGTDITIAPGGAATVVRDGSTSWWTTDDSYKLRKQSIEISQADVQALGATFAGFINSSITVPEGGVFCGAEAELPSSGSAPTLSNTTFGITAGSSSSVYYAWQNVNGWSAGERCQSGPQSFSDRPYSGSRVIQVYVQASNMLNGMGGLSNGIRFTLWYRVP